MGELPEGSPQTAVGNEIQIEQAEKVEVKK